MVYIPPARLTALAEAPTLYRNISGFEMLAMPIRSRSPFISAVMPGEPSIMPSASFIFFEYFI